MTALTTTRAELRKRIGLMLGDCLPLTATSPGSVANFTDTINLGLGIENAKGRDIVFTSGDNLGTIRRVEQHGTGFVEFEDVGTATLESDTAELYNYRHEGWQVVEYHNAINMAIDQAWPLYATKVTVSAASTFSGTTTTVDVPSGIDQIESVEFSDVESLWQSVPQAHNRYGDGWSVEADGSDVVVRGTFWRQRLEGRSVRLIGYTRAAALDSDDETTAIPPEWICAKAAEILCLSRPRNPTLYNLGLVYRENAEKLENRIRTRRKGRPQMVTP